ncbi:unnamed protein product, partial [Menidia menidia]
MCMSLEARRSYFKQWAPKMNFKNWIILNGNKYMSGESLIIVDCYETLNFDRLNEVAVPTLAQATELLHDVVDYT